MTELPLLRVLLAGGGAYLLALWLTPWIRPLAFRLGCLAHPADDRWGRRIVPRLGGIPIALGFLAAAALTMPKDPRMLGLLLGGGLIAAVGMVDDFRPLHPNTKLIAQIITSCLVLFSGVQVDLANSWLSIPLTIGWLVLVMNAFNLMDNMDGLSAGIGAIAGAFCVWHALHAGHVVVAVVAASLTGATLGFLHYNLPPAKIFMGDTGSQVLGLGLGALSLMETWHQPVRLLGLLSLPTLLLAVPIFDTLFVTLQRMLHGRHPFRGGTDHVSHRLGLLGLTPRQVVFALYGLTALLGILSLIPLKPKPLTILGLWLLAVGILLLLGSYLAKVRVYAADAPVPTDTPITVIGTMLMHKRRIAEVLADFVFICACYVTAHALRFEGNLTPDIEALILKSLPWVITVKMTCFFACGLYRGLRRYISLSDLTNILRAVLMSSALSGIVVLYLWRFEGYSRAVFIIDGTLLFLAVSGARLVEPMLNEWISASAPSARRVLIIGAGDVGELMLQHFKLDRQRLRRVVGFLDDDLAKQGDCIHGIPILGTRRQLGQVVQQQAVQEVFLAIRRPPEELVRQVQSYCEENGLTWSQASSFLSGIPTPRETA